MNKYCISIPSKSSGGHCLLSLWLSVSSRHDTCTEQHQQLRPNPCIFLQSGVPSPVPHKHLRFGRTRGSFLAVNKWVLPGVGCGRIDYIIQPWTAQLKFSFFGGKKPTAIARNVKSASACMINDSTIEAWNHVACTLKKLPL